MSLFLQCTDKPVISQLLPGHAAVTNDLWVSEAYYNEGLLFSHIHVNCGSVAKVLLSSLRWDPCWMCSPSLALDLLKTEGQEWQQNHATVLRTSAGKWHLSLLLSFYWPKHMMWQNLISMGLGSVGFPGMGHCMLHGNRQRQRRIANIRAHY